MSFCRLLTENDSSWPQEDGSWPRQTDHGRKVAHRCNVFGITMSDRQITGDIGFYFTL
jgi:hypothetical protein